MRISLIYARSENFCIGRGGKLPWSLPAELAHFMSTVSGHALIMGRRTYADPHSYPPGSLKIVISRNPELPLASGFLRAASLAEAQALLEEQDQEAFVIGGGQLLTAAFPVADTVHETVVHGEFEGDAYIEAFDFRGWRTSVIEEHPADAAHSDSFTIYRHERPAVT